MTDRTDNTRTRALTLEGPAGMEDFELIATHLVNLMLDVQPDSSTMMAISREGDAIIVIGREEAKPLEAIGHIMNKLVEHRGSTMRDEVEAMMGDLSELLGPRDKPLH